MYVALNERYEDVLIDATSSDPICVKYFTNKEIYGYGKTPDRAAEDLLQKMIANGYTGGLTVFDYTTKIVD
jgi:hypothetical protein